MCLSNQVASDLDDRECWSLAFPPSRDVLLVPAAFEVERT
jgi:hypothetical protein